jgi:predicted nucleotidyltransferase
MLTDLFKTEERLKILYYVLYRNYAGVTLVSKETGTNKGLVSRYLNKLARYGMLRKTDKKYSVVDSAMVRAVKILLNLNRLGTEPMTFNWVIGMGIFGSWAQGTNTYESDLDVWVRAERYPPELDLAKLQGALKKMAGCETNLLVLTQEKLREIRTKDAPFYNSLMRTSIVLAGEPIE